MRSFSLKLGTMSLALAAVGACATDAIEPEWATVGLRFAGINPDPAPGLRATLDADSVVLWRASDTLVLNKVEILLRQVDLRRMDLPGCDVATCAAGLLGFGTTLLTVPLRPGAWPGVTGNSGPGFVEGLRTVAPAGVFSGVVLAIHALGSDRPDTAFAARFPGWPAGASIRVSGSFNGSPFVYAGRMDEERGAAFATALRVPDGATGTATVLLDVVTWFVRESDGALLDPSTANPGGPNESLVEEAIRRSISAFPEGARD